jgi:hypothetical protein
MRFEEALAVDQGEVVEWLLEFHQTTAMLLGLECALEGPGCLF